MICAAAKTETHPLEPRFRSEIADGWNGVRYPKGMKSEDYLGCYSSRFDTVEVDSTFYRCPTIEAVNNWKLTTPPGFIFSLKIPRTVGNALYR